MDIFILLSTMLVCFLIGMPIAYALALAAIAGAWSIGIPLEAVMLKISDGVSKVAMLTVPFFVLAGAIMAEGGMARRLVAFADVLVGWLDSVGCAAAFPSSMCWPRPFSAAFPARRWPIPRRSAR
jgi:TRAP-type mannitol/chloroaromatic compound transport system permease large subunit